MNRIIKFRVWDTRFSEPSMIYIDDLYWFEENHVKGFNEEGLIFQQFTGLLDTEGREIYEGDILKISGAKYPNLFQVIWGEGEFNIPLGLYLKRVDNSCAWSLAKERNKKIVGNIFENPKLINE